MANDLCSSCARRDNCIHRTARSGVFQCEEFEQGTPTGAEPAGKPEVLGTEQKAGPRRDLCCNCDLREGCVFPRPGRPVWFCEEHEAAGRRSDRTGPASVAVPVPS